MHSPNDLQPFDQDEKPQFKQKLQFSEKRTEWIQPQLPHQYDPEATLFECAWERLRLLPEYRNESSSEIHQTSKCQIFIHQYLLQLVTSTCNSLHLSHRYVIT